MFNDFMNVSEITAATADVDKAATHVDVGVNVSHGLIQEGFRVSNSDYIYI
jgi:hypothetical protein